MGGKVVSLKQQVLPLGQDIEDSQKYETMKNKKSKGKNMSRYGNLVKMLIFDISVAVCGRKFLVILACRGGVCSPIPAVIPT